MKRAANQKALAEGPNCNARNRQGKPCGHRKGARTDHPGYGRCWLHGGKTPIITGQHTTVKRTRWTELVEEAAANPDPLNTLPELSQARALLAMYLERHQDDMDRMDIAVAAQLQENVSKTAERAIRSAATITLVRVQRLWEEFARVVDVNVTDARVRENIKRGWEALLAR